MANITYLQKDLSLSEWCGHYGVQAVVCTIRCGDSMVRVFYGARQCGAIVR